MGEASDDPVDHARTFRPHAGETLTDRAAWPGLAFIALGITAVVLGLTAAGYRLYGWVSIAGVSALAFFFVGWLWLHVERKRIRQMESQWHQEHSEPRHD
ncbi:protein UsfY [Mycobacteroides salmoniphilum]|uniref:protein UsfY n=1 Tax=Mycobacteroides salmoniphilum TaxID=404941 RepID=UPI0009937C12|nr:protein UsfY [Mycobacteroides salmoniphilum]